MGRTKRAGKSIEGEPLPLRILLTISPDGTIKQRKLCPTDSVPALSTKKKTAEKTMKDPRFTLMSHYFIQEQQQEYPKLVRDISPKRIQQGAAVLDKLHRIEGYSYEEIQRVLNFTLQDEFWRPNLLSPSSLRKISKGNGEMKFVNIMNAMEREKIKTQKPVGAAKRLEGFVIGPATGLNRLAQDILNSYEDIPGDAGAFSPSKAKCKLTIKRKEQWLKEFALFVKELPNPPGVATCTPPTGNIWVRFLRHIKQTTGYDPISGRRVD